MNRSLFITGTDTDAGKTLLTAALLAAARHQGQPAMVMKPLQTGATRRGEAWAAPDPDLCLRLAGLEVDAHTYRQVAPACFEPACSPHLAADQAGASITIPPLVTAFRHLADTYHPVLVEGAGGVFVPLNDRETMLSLMQALELPVLVAARPGLGTINHTLLTLHALRSHGLTVGGVVIVETRPTAWGYIERDNRTTIERMGRTPVLGIIPYMAEVEHADTAPEALLSAGARILDALHAG